MSETNMTQYSAITDSGNKVEPSYVNARKKVMVDRYTFSGNAGVSIGDTFLMNKIPENALILGAKIFCPSLGTAGIFSLGLAAYTNRDGTSVSADNNSLVNQADAGGQVVNKSDDLNSVAIGKEIGAGGAQPYLYCDEAPDAEDGVEIIAIVEYALPN